MKQPIWHSAHSWDVASGGRPLYRGFFKPSDDRVIVVKSPSQRPPVDTDPHVQTKIDDWFLERFGIRFRESSIYATGDFQTAQRYAADFGQVRRLVPKDKFCFCWSPKSEDLYTELMLASKAEQVDHLMDRLNFQCDGIEEAIVSGNEIMLISSAVEAILISHS